MNRNYLGNAAKYIRLEVLMASYTQMAALMDLSRGDYTDREQNRTPFKPYEVKRLSDLSGMTIEEIRILQQREEPYTVRKEKKHGAGMEK